MDRLRSKSGGWLLKEHKRLGVMTLVREKASLVCPGSQRLRIPENPPYFVLILVRSDVTYMLHARRDTTGDRPVERESVSQSACAFGGSARCFGWNMQYLPAQGCV